MTRKCNKTPRNANLYSLGSALKGALNTDGSPLNGAIMGASSAIGNAISGGHSSGVGNAMLGLSSIASAIPVYGKFIGPAMNIVGGAINGMFGGPSINAQALKENAEGNSKLMATSGVASSFNEIQGIDNTMKGFLNVAKNSLFGGGASAINAREREKRENAEAWAQGQQDNAIETLKKGLVNSALRNFKAFGGDLDTHGGTFDTGFTFIGEGGSHESNPNQGVQVGVDLNGTPNLVEEGEVIWKEQQYVFSKRLKANKKLLEDNNLPTRLAGKSFADIAKILAKPSEERPVDSVALNTRNDLFSRLMVSQEIVREKKAANKAKQEYNALSPEELNALMSQEAQQEAIQQELDNMQLTQEQLNAALMMGSPMFAHGGRMGNLFDGLGTTSNLLVNNVDSPEFTSRWKTNPKDIAKALEMIKGFHPFEGLDTLNDTNLGDVVVTGINKLQDAPIIDKVSGVPVLPKTNLTSIENPLTYADIAKLKKYKEPEEPDTTIRQTGRGTADALRYSTLVPGLYGLFNPPTAGQVKATRARDVVFSPSGVQMNINPMDINYLVNQINANARATDRGIISTSGGNRATAMAGLIANGYNTTGSIGKAYQTALEYNNALKQKQAEFYNQRDLANAQGAMSAMAHNQSSDDAYQQRLAAANAYNQELIDKVYQTKLGNLENLFSNIGAIGEDILNRKDAEFAAKANREAILGGSKKACGGNLKCNGGKLKRKR